MKKQIAAVAVLALSATLAFAGPSDGGQRHNGHGRHGKAGFGAKFAEKLNLTDEQKARVSAIRQATKEQNAAFFESARQHRQELRAAREANDSAKAQSLAGTIEADRAQMKQIRSAEKDQIMALLTAEQRAQMDAMKAQREAHRGQRGNRQPRG